MGVDRGQFAWHPSWLYGEDPYFSDSNAIDAGFQSLRMICKWSQQSRRGRQRRPNESTTLVQVSARHRHGGALQSGNITKCSDIGFSNLSSFAVGRVVGAFSGLIM